ncbi:MAG: ABC transporter permease [Gammaproteobacteria bacterium]|nr:ABC transporter permease [Gammaproteobacteria bacterium]
MVGSIFLALLVAWFWAFFHGRKIVRTERTDLVFGNPAKALGGWHWVVAGVSTILLAWFYFSWDAARAFYPKAANELCQVAKVTNAVNPIRSVFPVQSRILRGTSFLERDGAQLESAARALSLLDLPAELRLESDSLVQEMRDLISSLTNPADVNPAAAAGLAQVAANLNQVTAQLADPDFPGPRSAEEQAAVAAQPGWGRSQTEIPVLPETDRGRRFDAITPALTDIASDFSKIRNNSPEFLARVENLKTRLATLREAIQQNLDDPAEAARRGDLVKQLDKTLKRIDDGTIFPPGALAGVEAAILQLDEEKARQQGGLRWIDALVMPGGDVRAGSTACSEQGSGRWLPKPSDTVATLARIADPSVGYKGIPLFWFKMKPVSEMVAFFVPDWVADLVPGEYPRHAADGSIPENFKSRVYDVAVGNFDSFSVPVPTGHMWDSILRVLTGLFLGVVLGVPLGLFMGLSRFAKGFFDPLIELYRPVPPLAWAPLILTIFGIHDDGKIFLLFMVAFAIMVISARTGATGTQLSKIHAAHSLGATNRQILREVILPNSLPEILTGIRISIGVCWGTLVAAEMLAGTTGIGFVENVARKQSDYEIIWVTIILLGLLGLLFDLVMRWIIDRTIPWRGKG